MDYKGRLNKLYTKYVQDYIEKGVIFGYISHDNRTDKTDEALEEAIEKLNFEDDKYSKYDLIGVFLCSRDARHLMDQLYNIKGFKKYISDEENLMKMITFGLDYSFELEN